MSDGEELYDEFGNYIGPDLESSDDDDGDDDGQAVDQRQAPDDASDVSDEDADKSDAMVVRDESALASGMAEPMSSVVLHEDKEHYQTATQVFGEDVRTAVLDEDAMELETPLVEPVKNQSVRVDSNVESEDWMYDEDYLTTVLISNETTRTRRGVAIIGHLHHGKTCLIDFLLEQTLRKPWGPRASLDVSQGGGPRCSDAYKSEQERQMSLVSTPISALLPDTRGKTYCLTMVDCPGHPNFHDETVASLKIADGAVVVVDAIEGIMMHTNMAVRQAVAEGLPITLLISKIDRLIVEVKLPPKDTYFKLLHLVEEMNDLIQEISIKRYPKLAPQLGNVAFASAQHGWLFTLPSFAEVYLEHGSDEGLGNNLPAEEFAKRLWGDSYLDPTTRRFRQSSRDCSSMNVPRTFVSYILEPLYKIYAACLGERATNANTLLRSVGVLLTKDELRSSGRPLLRSALSRFMRTASCGFVDMVVRHVPSPAMAAKGKVARCYKGALDSPAVSAMTKCDPRGPLIIHCVKMYASADGLTFSTFGRVYSGSVKPGEQVRVLGEGYSPQDEEDMAVATVEAVALPRGRHRTEVTVAKAGNWVLLDGIDAKVSKTATLVSVHADLEELDIFTPLKFPEAGGDAVMKVAIEPLNPSELPQMVEGLRRVSKAYPMVKTRVEESGEHVLLGTGELYLDCVMHDLRHLYSNLEVKLSDPSVSLRESVRETSSIKCFAETANKRNKLTFISEPLDDGLAEGLEAGKVNPKWGTKKTSRFFQTQYGWDLLSSRSVWAFGDSPTNGTNILMDDTLPSEVNKGLLASCKSSIVQGFQWATRDGPLCEEPVRGTRLKILNAVLADKPIHRGGGQIIPTTRKTVHSAILTATPRLMEPVYRLQIQCPVEIVGAIEPVLTRRRGHIVQDRPIPGSIFSRVTGFLPLLDSFGFETDLRTFSQGQAMVFSVFDHWANVPGDPLDRNIVLHPLEPSPAAHLARELLLKTRRRKGLSEDVYMNKFFDEQMVVEMDLSTDATTS